MYMIATLVVWRNITVTLACTTEKVYLNRKKCNMWVSNLYSVESILYLWPWYEVDIDLCSSDARPRSLDSDTWMNCAISLTRIHISFPYGHQITHAHFVYFSPSVGVKFVFLPRPTSLSHRNTHALYVQHAHPFNSAHPQPLMSHCIIMSLAHMLSTYPLI